MCSQSDDPTTYDPPTVTKPRTYVLAGDARRVEQPKPSIALAVIGDMLEQAETAYTIELGVSGKVSMASVAIVETLRAARDRIAKAEAAA